MGGLPNEFIPTPTYPQQRCRKSATTDWAHHVRSSRGLITIVVMTLLHLLPIIIIVFNKSRSQLVERRSRYARQILQLANVIRLRTTTLFERFATIGCTTWNLFCRQHFNSILFHDTFSVDINRTTVKKTMTVGNSNAQWRPKAYAFASRSFPGPSEYWNFRS